MKNLTKILANLRKSLGFEPFIDDQLVPIEQPPVANPEVTPTTDEVPWTLDQNNTEVVVCGYTEAEIVRATICGEGKGCGHDGMVRIWQVILNRAVSSDPGAGNEVTLDRGEVVQGADGYLGVVLKPKQFSCWNSTYDDCHEVSPFTSCEEFKKRMECLVKYCDEVPPGGFGSAPGALERLGFTDGEATQVRHYMTPKALLTWPYVCPELKEAFRRASNGNLKWKGCVSVTCRGVYQGKPSGPRKTRKVCSDGCHVFISNA